MPLKKKMNFTKTTEQSSKYEHLEQMSVADLLQNINSEDKTVPLAVEKSLPQIEALVTKIVEKIKKLLYIQNHIHLPCKQVWQYIKAKNNNSMWVSN